MTSTTTEPEPPTEEPNEPAAGDETSHVMRNVNEPNPPELAEGEYDDRQSDGTREAAQERENAAPDEAASEVVLPRTPQQQPDPDNIPVDPSEISRPRE